MKAALLLPLLLLAACKREDRPIQVEPPAAGRVSAIAASPLLPGSDTSPAHMTNGYEESAYAVSQGKQLFSDYNCVGCHSHGGGGMGPALMDSLWIYGSAPDQVFATIAQGRPNGMPAWGSRIPAYQIWELVAYVRSMSGLVNFTVAPGRSDHLYGGQPENSRSPEPPRSAPHPTP